MIYKLLEKFDQHLAFDTAKAHCDIPCGIYDPITAQINALTVVRMIDLITHLENTHKEHDADFMNSMSRYVAVKEEHAEKAKHEIRVIWGDYIKAPHVEKHPEIPELVHKIMQLGSKSRQTVDRDTALQFVEAINQFAEIFWDTKGIAIKRAKAPYPPALELVYPNL
ncbi:MAG: superoxide dismutase, Ni [Anaerolineales bacterium]|nr:superoxide dismutase, Ni [Anaerolineales bacterium]